MFVRTTASRSVIKIFSLQRSNQTMAFIHTLLVAFFTLSSFVQASNEEGIAYLKANKEKAGVVELPSGLQYKILESGNGDFHPKVNARCKCHYAGTLIDGTPFDSSYDRGEPTTFAPNQVIKGWTEAMQLMVEGDKWELTIPSEMAYGDSGSPPKIPGGSVLVFTIEIIEILDEDGKVPAAKCNAVTKEKCNEKEVAYLSKIGSWDKAKKKKEIERLEKILADSDKNLKPELATWVVRRQKILKQLTDSKEEKEL